MSRFAIKEQQLKEAFLVVAEHFTSHFQEIVKQAEGIIPEKIKIQTLKLDRRIGKNNGIFLVDVFFSSDYGLHQGKLALKFYETIERTVQEAEGAMILSERLKKDPKVNCPQLLYFNKDLRLLIYEGIIGEGFDESLIPEKEKFFLAGRSLPYFHGYELKEVKIERYQYLLKKLLTQLTSVSEKKNIESLFKKNFRRIQLSFAGTNVFGDFHPGNIMFQKKKGFPNQKSSLTDHFDIFLLDPEFIKDENNQVDRCEDFGTFFAGFALNEYLKKGSFNETVKKVNYFIAGYNNAFKSVTDLKFEQLYAEGMSLSFHIALGILFDTLYSQRLVQQGEKSDEWGREAIKTRIEIIKKILESNLFEIKAELT